MSLPKNKPEVEKCQANVVYRAHLSRLRLLAYPGCLAISRSMRRAGGGIPNPEAIRFSDSVSGISPRATPSEIGHSPHTVAALFGYPPYGRAAHRQCVKILTVRQDIDGQPVAYRKRRRREGAGTPKGRRRCLDVGVQGIGQHRHT